MLGLLDSLEATILEGFKVPMSKKVIVNEEQVLMLIDKIRLVIQGGSNFAKKAINRDHAIRVSPPANFETKETVVVEEKQPASPSSSTKERSAEIVQEAYQIAQQVREGADKYADEVLSNLELTSSRILRTIKAGRDRLSKNVQGKETISDKINV